jgi:hypothetical protein
MSGNLRFVPPSHYELRTEEKRQGVRNEKTECSERVVRNVSHPVCHHHDDHLMKKTIERSF